MKSDISNSIIKIDKTGFSVNTIIGLFLISALIFGLFFVLRKYIIPFLDSRSAIKRAKQNTFRIEVVTWFTFTLFALTQLMREAALTTIVLICVSAAVGLNFWIDLFIGIRFRFENKFKLNDAVRFNNYIGLIEKINYTSIVLKTEDEERVYLNYRKILNGTLIKRQSKGKLFTSKVLLNIGTLSEEMVIRKLEEWIYQSPWAVVGDKNTITAQPGGLLSVTVSAVDLGALNKVEQMLKERIGELKDKR